MILKKNRNVLKSLKIRNKYYFKWANGGTIGETPIIPPPIQNIVFLFLFVILIEIFLKGGIIAISLCKTLTSCFSQDRLNKPNTKDFAQQLFLILVTCQRKTSKGKGCRITQLSQPMEPPTSRPNIPSDHGLEREEDKGIVEELFTVSTHR